MSEIKLIKKISPNTICEKDLKRLEPDQEVHLYDVYGMVNTFQAGQTDKGPWLKFKGQFEAIVESSGEIYNSGAAFLPQPFEDMLFAELTKAKENDPNATVQFACRVSIVGPKKGKVSATGYEYRCMPLIDQSTESPLAQMRKLIGEKRKTLALAANNGAKEEKTSKRQTV